MRFFSNNLLTTTRRFLIIGAMLGLFFSSGEGIHLLPFTAASTGDKENTVHFESGKSKSYSYSVHNSIAHLVQVKSKAQKNLKDFDSAGKFSGGEFQLPKFFGAIIGHSYHQPVFFNPSIFTASPSDRAPPVI